MTRINLQNTTIENEIIAINDTATFNAIGPSVTLKNCDLQISVPSRALSIRGTIIGGRIQAKRELQGFDWLDTRLDGVTFKGRFKNNRFGTFPPMYHNGTIENCDFSNARLRDALFINTNCEGVKFGTWPKFTISNTPEFHTSLGQVTDSNATVDYLIFLAKYIRDYGNGAVTLNYMTLDAEDLCKRKGFDVEYLRLITNVISGIVRV
jgi:hypothetical protein